ncbi:MAG: cadherin-like beta sandwich domain-containing protein, partial [Lachnospiraceae bacterium]|nr:cadherin-like beta sandwich domain-containing protein [Lachnospiraceae bacterium]
MKNSIINTIKGVIVALFVTVLCIMNDNTIYAASANVTISSATVEEGEDVAVTVTISSDTDIAGYHLSITYDANLLQYVSGGDGDESAVGSIPLFNDLLEAKSATRTLNFKAKKSGSAVISVASGSSIIDLDTNDMEIVSTNSTITINAHVESSDNNFLSKLEIVGVRENGTTAAYNITQRGSGAVGFNKDELEYRAYVANDIVKFAVTAVAEDATNGATVAVTGVELEEGGNNTTTITVTAQNGTKRVYEIFTYRVPSEPESESESTTEPESESESESGDAPVVTPVDKEVTIGSDVYIITNIAEDTILPEGFSTFEYTYDGQVYIAAKGEAKKLTILQLVKKGTEEKALYVYDEANNIFYKFINIQIINKMYTVTEKPDEVKIPADFSQSLVNIDGEMVNVWVNKNDTNIYMFYGMNWNGASGLYLYDATEKTAIRYVPLSSVPAVNTVTPEPTTNNVENESDAQKENQTSDNKIIIIVEACVILILIIVIVIILLKNKDNDDDDGDDDDGDDEIED